VEAALASDAWLAEPGWLAEVGGAACCGPEPGLWVGVTWLPLPPGAGLPGAGLPGAALAGPELPPCPELLPRPAITLWAELVTELVTEPTAELTGDAELAGDAGLPPGAPAVSVLRPLTGESGVCVAAGFWSAAARPATRTAKTSAAANAPHAYKQTLRASSKAREKVADPSTANKLPPDADNHPYVASRRTRPTC
jgi:hypothetical protein